MSARGFLSLSQARRVSLSSLGFCKPRPASEVNAGHIRRTIDRLGLLQLDFVNVLVPAHYLVLFSRLGAYDKSKLAQLVYQQRAFTEQWAHEASIIPAGLWPHLEYRRKAYRPYANSPILKIKGKSSYLKQIYELIEEKGAITSRDLPPFAGPERRPGDWHRSVPRWALECHFGSGKLAIADRLSNFQRVYDLPERVLEPDVLKRRINTIDARRELLRIAATALGVATAADIADYFRMPVREALPRINELVEDGALLPVDVESWDETAYLAAGARMPRSIECATLLSPFDPAVWFRPRALRLFDFHYRIEIYVPAAKRKYGYYVLPFLMDERIVARVDLKADRKNGVLLVQASHAEENIDVHRVSEKLLQELWSLADWLGLGAVKIGRRGSLARPLGACARGKTQA